MSIVSGCRDVAHEQMRPFDSAEAAWFWFVQAQVARLEGARISAGAGTFQRPCEPVDIYRELDRRLSWAASGHRPYQGFASLRITFDVT